MNGSLVMPTSAFVQLFHSPQCQLRVDLDGALIKSEQHSRIIQAVSPHRDNSLPPCRETGRGYVSTPKTLCEVKLDLLIKYVESLEKLKIARLEHGVKRSLASSQGFFQRTAQNVDLF